MAKKRNDTSKIDALLASVTGDMLNVDPSQPFVDNSLRVERILLEMLRPDPVQPRRVLPEALHHRFHNNQLTPSQALRELVQITQVAARQRSRPFASVLELLSDSESGNEQPKKLTPEEATLRDLVNLAVTLQADGQVNPLTVVDVSQGVTRLYRIETGERRYWAAWLLRDFVPDADSDGMIDCIVVPAEQSSVFRQAKENTARKGLNAMAMARQAALLLLTVHGYEIPMEAVNNDFYRQALDLDLRGKRKYTDLILTAMGGITRSYFSYYKSLLKLSDEAIELADRHSIDEKRLRYVVAVAQDAQSELVRQIIDFNLSSKQIKQIVEVDEVDEVGRDANPNEKLVSRTSLKLARSVRDVNKVNGIELAQALVTQEQNVHMALARLRAMKKLLSEAEQELLREENVDPGQQF